MLFLVEMDHVKSGMMSTPESGQAFIEHIIFPTLARADELVAEKKILAGGPVAGRVVLRFIVDADSLQEADRIVSSLPLWAMSETHVTPLIAFGDRRTSLHHVLERLSQA
jgi:muconolactone delta-isomerase